MSPSLISKLLSWGGIQFLLSNFIAFLSFWFWAQNDNCHIRWYSFIGTSGNQFQLNTCQHKGIDKLDWVKDMVKTVNFAQTVQVRWTLIDEINCFCLQSYDFLRFSFIHSCKYVLRFMETISFRRGDSLSANQQMKIEMSDPVKLVLQYFS